MVTKSSIHVCQSSVCRGRGSEVVLVEIEELAKLVNNNQDNDDNNTQHKLSVHPTGCLGYCFRGPAVVVNVTKKPSKGRRAKTSRSVCVEVNTFEKSADVLKKAICDINATPDLLNLPIETQNRLMKTKKRRAREHNISTYQWNKALQGLAEDAEEDGELYEEYTTTLSSAGYSNPNILASSTSMPEKIEGYVKWNLDAVHIVSKHSAVFELTTKDRGRGTPHPRGGGRRMPSPVTWHVTMLGEVGKNNDEGPLPWIERDYTPISGAWDWERGTVRILIKIYNGGQLTSWLHKRTKDIANKSPSLLEENTDGVCNDVKIWLSKPLKTLSIPNLTSDMTDGFRPASILLFLAGTGVVALPQILACREPHRLLGISTPRKSQLLCPIDLIMSFREDDMLMLDEINEWCTQGTKSNPPKFQGIRNCTLFISDRKNSGSDQAVPFPEFRLLNEKILNEMEKLNENITIRRSERLDKKVVTASLEKLVEPSRVVLSGPDKYNQDVRQILEDCGFDVSKKLTVLSA